MANANILLNNSPLQSLQAAFCLIKLSGDLLVVDRNEVALMKAGQLLGQINFYSRDTGTILMKRHLEQFAHQSDVKKTIGDFWVHPNTHVYTDIAFNPLPQPVSTLNYWSGSLITPAPGNWDVIKNHLMDVICANDIKLYEYLIKFMAHMLQHPEEKPGVMIILLGKQGTGKGLFFQILQCIWSRSTLLVSDINQVVGKFNAALERHYVILMDEALFSGDRKSQDRMKSLITEKTCHIEQKFQPSRTIESVHRFFASSNHNQFSHVEADDRRSLFIRVSEVRQGDRAYFTSLVQAIDNNSVIAAMVHDLANIDLTEFDVRVRPITDEHSNQKLLSLQGIDRYWYEALLSGKFPAKWESKLWKDRLFIPTSWLQDSYQEFDKRSQRFAPTLSKEIADAMARLCPSAKKCRKTNHSGHPQRGYALPDLTAARKEFENVYKCTIDWGDLEEAVETLVAIDDAS